MAEFNFSGDPASKIQSFPKLDIQLLCCRHWWMRNWEHPNLSFPFWRIYYNSQENGTIIYQGKEYHLNPNFLYVICPNTPYSTRLHDHPIPERHHKLIGGSIHDITDNELQQLIESGAIEHLFLHFYLGFPYDNIRPGIFVLPINENRSCIIKQIKAYLKETNTRFNIHIYLQIQELICDLLSCIPSEQWEHQTTDARIHQCLIYIEAHLKDDLANERLADYACMATNSFTRLFKQEIGFPPQVYIKKKRIDKASSLLVHTNMSIGDIASETGFSNRYHFSRIFNELTGQTPAFYRKVLIV